MKRVLVTIPEGDVRNTFLPAPVRCKLEERFDVNWNQLGRQYTREELRDLLRHYDAVLTGWGTRQIGREVLEGNERLKLIVHTGGTVGNLVEPYTYDHGCRVFSGNQMYAESVAEGTIAYMLMAQRRIPDYMDKVRGGQWRSEGVLWEGLLDKTIGIVGVGTISTILMRMLKTFRVRLKVYSSYPIPDGLLEECNGQEATLEEIFSTCEIVSVHSALSDKTRGLIGKKHFDLLQEGALFVNTARGDVIDEPALIEALQTGRFRAVLDVYHQEPLPLDSLLRTLPNVYAIPHMAGPTLDRRPRITDALIDEMVRFFQGEEHFALEIDRVKASYMTKM